MNAFFVPAAPDTALGLAKDETRVWIMAIIPNRDRVHVATTESVNFFAYCEGKLCAFTKTERHQFESGATRVAIVASIILVIELVLLR
jgi:hypothetical protein